MKIFGAGFAGLLAGCHFQTATIFDNGFENEIKHQALMRFRTPTVGDSVGITFRKIKVHKGVFIYGGFVKPNVMLSNLYSKKVIGRVVDRSIWDIETCERYVAPNNFLDVLKERCKNRIVWGHEVSKEEFIAPGQKISTIPMATAANFVCEIGGQAPEFSFEYITVKTWVIKNADVFQSVYFPDPETSLYRASISGDRLIAEYIGEADEYDVFYAFGLSRSDCFEVGNAKQVFGKIADIPTKWRKNFIYRLTTEYEIYSLGRFATWRNILLDDVLKDIYVLKKIMESGSYDAVFLST